MTELIGISITALLLGMMLRDYNKTASLLLVLFAGALIFYNCAGGIFEIIKEIKSFSEGAEEASVYVNLMLKVLGIALITQIISDLCRDSGETALAGQTELAAKIIIITMVLPLFKSIVKIINGLIV